jgi:hypothetical protein
LALATAACPASAAAIRLSSPPPAAIFSSTGSSRTSIRLRKKLATEAIESSGLPRSEKSSSPAR